MLALVGATLIDGTGAPPLPDSAILIANGKIKEVGPKSNVSILSSTEVIDLSGLTVIPGLIDCHDHLVAHSEDRAGAWGLDEPWSLHYLRMADALREALETGYTSIRDAGGMDIGFKIAVEQGLIPGPRLVLSLSIISPTGGIGDLIHSSGWGHAKIPSPFLPSGVANGVEGVRACVRELLRAGADVIKIATTGGVSSRPGHGPKDAAFTSDELAAIVDEAHSQGKRVMCHAIGGIGLRNAIEAGVDSIDHGGYLDEDPDLIPLMATKGIFYVPTLLVYVLHRTRGAPFVQARGNDMYPHHVESIRRALAAGIKIGAGTDARQYNHGTNAQELECLVEAGLSTMQALQAATDWAAQCIGLGEVTGTVESGKFADLLVVAGSPLEDIKLLQDPKKIKLVMKEGKAYFNRLSSPI